MVCDGRRVGHPHIRDPLVEGEGVVGSRQRRQAIAHSDPARRHGERSIGGLLAVFPRDRHIEPEAPVGELEGWVDGGVGLRVLGRRVHGRAEVVVDARGRVAERVRGHEVRRRREDRVPLLERRGRRGRAVLRLREVHRVRLLPDQERVDLARRRAPRRVRHLAPSRARVALTLGALDGRGEIVAVCVREAAL